MFVSLLMDPLPRGFLEGVYGGVGVKHILPKSPN